MKIRIFTMIVFFLSIIFFVNISWSQEEETKTGPAKAEKPTLESSEKRPEREISPIETVREREISPIKTELVESIPRLVLPVVCDIGCVRRVRENYIREQNRFQNELAKLTFERQKYDLEVLRSYLNSDTNLIESDKIILAEITKKLKKENLPPDERTKLEGEKSRTESYIVQDQSSIKNTEDQIANAKKLDIDIILAEKRLADQKELIFQVENKLEDLVDVESTKQSFRIWISIAFCLLVAIVIIGFYVIAFHKEIAPTIFSGEKGIQFITLFLIIIAIILFGIMGILEGKELAALLGGLSGYILGRTTSPIQESK